nr:MAG TPA: hypothetical protein [Caudoviricetes sp.]
MIAVICTAIAMSYSSYFSLSESAMTCRHSLYASMIFRAITEPQS